ncbi:MAG: hypothetical protein ABI867_27945 [Kofleriaceae bacterium]
MGLRLVSSMFLVVLGASPVAAQPKPVPALVGATELAKLTTPAGFIDDAVAAEGDRFAYVVADSSTKAELHVITLATKAEQVVELSAITLQPTAIELVGARALVIGVNTEGKQVAAMVELAKGKVAYKVAPATTITVITREGKRRIAVHRATTTAAGVRHEVELLAIETGSRLAARSLELAGGTTNKALDLRVNHWSDGFTRAYGIKGGEWDRKENQRSPDSEATYDVITAKLDKKKIDDLFEQRRRFQALADAGGQLDFVRLGWDSKGLQAWRAGKPRELELDQPLATYDAKSLQGEVTSDGSVWLALKVDPVNPDAVARKKADPEYLDVFRAPADGKAARKARILAQGTRHRFGIITGDKFLLVERNQSMERGGKSLTLYQLQ